MQFPFTEMLFGSLGVIAGGVIGLAFGLLQQAALRPHAERELAGKLKTAWSLIPGAGARVAYLLIALALVQLICPLLFTAGTQWLVSAGVLAGYGWTLLSQLRARLRADAS